MTGPVKVLGGDTILNNSKQSNILEVLECHQGPCECICMDYEGKHFATGGSDALIVIWSIHEMMPIKTITKCDRKIRNISYSYDSQYLAVTSDDYDVNIFKADPEDNGLLNYYM